MITRSLSRARASVTPPVAEGSNRARSSEGRRADPLVQTPPHDIWRLWRVKGPAGGGCVKSRPEGAPPVGFERALGPATGVQRTTLRRRRGSVPGVRAARPRQSDAPMKATHGPEKSLISGSASPSAHVRRAGRVQGGRAAGLVEDFAAGARDHGRGDHVFTRRRSTWAPRARRSGTSRSSSSSSPSSSGASSSSATR